MAPALPQRGSPKLGGVRIHDVQLAAARGQHELAVVTHLADDPELLDDVAVGLAAGGGLDELGSRPGTGAELGATKDHGLTASILVHAPRPHHLHWDLPAHAHRVPEIARSVDRRSRSTVVKARAATQSGAARYLVHSSGNSNASGLTAAAGLRAVVRRRMGHPFAIDFSYHDEIPRGPGKPTVPMTPRITFLGSHSGVFAFIQDPAKPWIEQTLAASRPGAPTTDATEPRKTVEPATPGRPATQPAPKPDQLSNAELGRISRAARRTTEGRDYTQDPAWQKQAEVIVERAVKGDVMAMAAAYYLYAYGIGVEKDEDEAAAWARQASDSGLDQGKRALATAYRDGVGVEPSNDAFEQLAGDVDPITMAATGFALTQLDYKDPRAILAAGKLGGKILGGDNPFQSKPKSPGQALKKFDQEHAELYQHINSERIKLKKVDRQIRGIDEAADDLKQALQASRSRYTREQNAELDEAVVQLDRGIKHLRAADLDVATLNASIDEVYDASMWIGDVLAAAEGKAENQSKPAGRHAAATDEDEDDEQENDPKKSKPLEDLGNILKKPPWAR